MTTPTTTDPSILVARNVTPDEHTVELSLCPGDRATALTAWLLAISEVGSSLTVAVQPAYRRRVEQHLGAVLAHDLQDAAWPAPECAVHGCDGLGDPAVCASHADTAAGA